MVTILYCDTKVHIDAVPKALLVGLALVPTRLILLLQAMLGLLRLPLKALLANIPLEGGSIKMRVIGGSEHFKQFFFRNCIVSVVPSCSSATSRQSTPVLS